MWTFFSKVQKPSCKLEGYTEQTLTGYIENKRSEHGVGYQYDGLKWMEGNPGVDDFIKGTKVSKSYKGYQFLKSHDRNRPVGTRHTGGLLHSLTVSIF